jgi:hypothetical protein
MQRRCVIGVQMSAWRRATLRALTSVSWCERLSSSRCWNEFAEAAIGGGVALHLLRATDAANEVCQHVHVAVHKGSIGACRKLDRCRTPPPHIYDWDHTCAGPKAKREAYFPNIPSTTINRIQTCRMPASWLRAFSCPAGAMSPTEHGAAHPWPGQVETRLKNLNKAAKGSAPCMHTQQ